VAQAGSEILSDSASQCWSRRSDSNRRPAVYKNERQARSAQNNTDLARPDAEVARAFACLAEADGNTVAPVSAPTPDVVPTLDQLAARLHAAILGEWRPKRASRMTGHAETSKKYQPLADYRYSPQHTRDHLAGRATYAVSLALLGDAHAACRDYDGTTEAEAVAAQDAATAAGLVTALILMPNGRAHLWLLFDSAYAVADIRALMQRELPKGRGELYPSENPIRGPGGVHRVHDTRGVLRLPDGRRFQLDDPAQLVAGLSAWLDLPRNGRPAVAAPHERTTGGVWGDAYKAGAWEALPDGAAIWSSARVRVAAQQRDREPLAALLRGERAVLSQNGAPDDSSSAQVAALVFNLLSANFPEPEIRAVALHLRTTLRPGRTLDHFKAHIDAELIRYRPRTYQPEPTRALQVVPAAAPAALPAAEHRQQPKSRARKDRPQKVAGPGGYLAWLEAQAGASGVVLLSQAQCAEALGCSLRTVKRYESALGDAIQRDPYAQRQAGRLFLRGDNIAPAVAEVTAQDVVTAEPVLSLPDAPNVCAPSMHMEEHTPPPALVPSDATDAAEPSPAELAAALADVPGLRAAPPRLRELVAEGLDLYGDAPTRGKKSRAALVRWHVAENAGGTAHPRDQVSACYRAELMRRAVATWKLSKLRARLRLVEHLADKARQQGDASAAWWRFEAALLRDEQRRRPATPSREPRKNCEAMPDLRQLGERHHRREQQRLLRDAAPQLDLWRAEQAMKGTGLERAGGVCSPQTTPIAPLPPIEGTPAHLFAALRARQAAQGAS
jgi:hypothetical protein